MSLALRLLVGALALGAALLSPLWGGLSAFPGLEGAAAAGPTSVSGAISADTTWTLSNSPYVVTGTVAVNSGARLTIEPGVQVKFNGGAGLQVNGELIARGISGNLIYFTSNQASPGPGNWNGIYFSDSNADATYDAGGNYVSGSILQYTRIEYGGGDPAKAIHVSRSSLFMDHVEVVNNANTGVYEEYGELRITNSIISRNNSTWREGGIQAYYGSLYLSGSVVSDNSGRYYGGVMAAYTGNVTIIGNTITENVGSAYGGIRLQQGGGAIVENNTISRNSGNYGGGVSAMGMPVTISGNSIVDNTSGERGAGIEWWYATGTITNNTIVGNAAPHGGGFFIYGTGPTISHNNINNVQSGTPWDIYASTGRVNAANNWWGTTSDTTIQSRLWYAEGGNNLGLDSFTPKLTAPDVSAPPSPPADVMAATGADSTSMNWSANLEGDIAGYKVYYDADTGYPYQGTGADQGASPIDVGNVTNFTLSGLGANSYYAITAYDSSRNESWYSEAKPAVAQVNLFLTPHSRAVMIGSTFDVIIYVSPRLNQQYNGVDAFLNFDPAVLQVVGIAMAPGSLLPAELANSYDNELGQITYSAGKLSGPLPTTTFDLAIITFQAVGAATGMPLTFNTSFPRTSDAGLEGASVVGSLSGATITVIDTPMPDFTAAGASSGTTTVVAGETVNFTDTSTGWPSSWAWDFEDDGVTDSTSNGPSHVYTVAGVYSVKLTVTNDSGSDTLTRTNYITVTPSPLHHITVSPASASLAIGGTQTFTATTYDQYNNLRSGDTIGWSLASATVGNINAATGEFTAGTVAGSYTSSIVATSGAITGNASVTVTPGPLHHITVGPTAPSVQVGSTQPFAAQGYDQYGNARSGDVFSWSVTEAVAGFFPNPAIGDFQAGQYRAAGTYTDAIRATSGSIVGTASVTVTPGPLSRIIMNTTQLDINPGGVWKFVAVGMDLWSNEISDLSFTYTVTDPATGSIEAAAGDYCDFRAGTVAGLYPNAVRVAVGDISASVDVRILPDSLHHITVSPSHPTVPIGAGQTFTAQGYDYWNNARTGDGITWSVSNPLAGTINASTGLFTATSNSVNAADYADVIQATSGSVTGTASVNVVAGIINGTLTLQGSGRTAAGRTIPLTVRLFTVDPSRTNLDYYNGVGVVNTYTPTTINGGSNTVTFQIVGIVPDSYDITVAAGHTLINVKKNVAISGVTSLNFGMLLEGNCNNDSQVNSLDFSILASSYLRASGQTGYDARADFDYSGQVNSLDFSMLAQNYLKTNQVVVTP